MSEHNTIAVYGGSFDPPHLGHRNLIAYYLKNFPNTEKVLIIPNFVSPFKKTKTYSQDEIFHLCSLNFQDLDPHKVLISDIEYRKKEPSYTYETILELKKLYPSHNLVLLIGEDQLKKLPLWKEYKVLIQEVHKIYVFRRETEDPETIPIPESIPKEKVEILKNELWEPSSSDWKAWPKEEYLHPPVMEYLVQKSEEIYNSEKLNEWKSIVQKHVSQHRFEHILNVSKIAKELAIVHHYPFPNKIELAAILHDITKQKDISFHIQIFKTHHFAGYSRIPTAAYHAYSAYFYLQDLGILDEDILNPVKNHTLGNPKMTMGDCILYAADYFGSEYARTIPEYDYWLSKTSENLYFGVYIKAKTTISDLIEKNKCIHKNTIHSYNLALENIQRE